MENNQSKLLEQTREILTRLADFGWHTAVRTERDPPPAFMNKSVYSAALVVAVLVGSIETSTAQGTRPVDALIGNPPSALLTSLAETGPAAGFRTHSVTPPTPVLTASRGEVSWDVDIRYVDGEILNPKSGLFDKVRLRAYHGRGVDPQTPFVAPTVALRPGETFLLTLNNTLSSDDPTCVEHDDVNTLHCFNSTNMHAHGLWVSPSGNSDNVLIRVSPGVRFTYEYNVPADHPAGTFWYHPHLHGATAVQVSSGMAGALIIRGTRMPSPNTPGDIDTLLRHSDGETFRERILLLQQIPYACRDKSGTIKTDTQSGSGSWVCDPGDRGTVESADQFWGGVWKKSGRHTSINGHVVPTFGDAASGRIERWRLIHAGISESIKLRFRKFESVGAPVASVTSLAGASLDAQQAFVDSNCSGDLVPQFSLAMDGLTREWLVEQTESKLHPGYREDLLIVFDKPGTYCIIDGEATVTDTASQESDTRRLLGFVRVADGGELGGLAPNNYVKARLKAAAMRFMPPDVRDTVIADLDRELGLASFLPHESLAEVEPDGKQTLSFKGHKIGELRPGSSLSSTKLLSYDPERIDRRLRLGDVDEWTLASFSGGHPFHIHVNPFQVIEVLDPDGIDVSGYEPGNHSPYARLKGTWKDTLFVTRKGNKPYRVIVRTRYKRYIGDFVLHCHILYHEDMGMMQNVRITLPDGKGGMTASHH